MQLDDDTRLHHMLDVDLDRVWGTVTCNLPPLIQALEKIIQT